MAGIEALRHHMKFMDNRVLTIGTLNGANVKMREEVRAENIIWNDRQRGTDSEERKVRVVTIQQVRWS